MMFNSFGFIAFFIIVILGLFGIECLGKEKYRNLFLLIAGIVFYALFDIRCLMILLAVTGYTYWFGLKVKEDKKYLKVGVILSVTALALFKYFNFFVDSFRALLNISDSVLQIVAPVGISFYIFKSIAYLVDVKEGKCEKEKDFISLALYITFFPQIVAGPISKPAYLISQFKQTKKLNIQDLCDGLQIFLIGLFKKIVIADNISVFVNEVYRAPRIYSSLTVFLCVLAYGVQIYMDFSGYSDMAIGVSRMLGYNVEKNFNLPYISKNVTEFWKRWHISLSDWLMSYLYIPLGGNRKGKMRQYLNLFLTMLIGGLWHGANWTYIAWGAVNGLALIVHKIYREKAKHKLNNTISIILTFLFVSLTWILFRANGFANAKDIFVQLFSFKEGITYISSWAVVGIVFFFVTTIFMTVKHNGEYVYPLQDLTSVKGLFFFFMLIGLIVGLAYTGNNPFIYAQF